MFWHFKSRVPAVQFIGVFIRFIFLNLSENSNFPTTFNVKWSNILNLQKIKAFRSVETLNSKQRLFLWLFRIRNRCSSKRLGYDKCVLWLFKTGSNFSWCIKWRVWVLRMRKVSDVQGNTLKMFGIRSKIQRKHRVLGNWANSLQEWLFCRVY